MDSIYHIDTDIECSVLHYGKEVCMAKPGEDVSITLRKGRHKLSFVSSENSSDQYSTMFVVPENDIEDCIEVHLANYRNERLAREEEDRRHAQEQARKNLYKQLGPIFREAHKFDTSNRLRYINRDSSLFPAHIDGYADRFYVDYNGNIAIKTDYYARFPFHEGVACVGDISYYHFHYVPENKHSRQKLFPVYNIGFVDYNGNLVIPCVWKIDRELGFMGVFSQDRAFVLQNNSSLHDDFVFERHSSFIEHMKLSSPDSTVIYDENGRSGKVQFPSIRGNRYCLIDKAGNTKKILTNKKGLIPHFNPFRQGLSVILWTRVEDGINPFFSEKNLISLIEVVDWNGNVIISIDDIPAGLEFDKHAITVFIGETAYIGRKGQDNPYQLSDNSFFLSIESGIPTISRLKNNMSNFEKIQNAAFWYYQNLFVRNTNEPQYTRKISRNNYQEREFLAQEQHYRLSRFKEFIPEYSTKILSLDKDLL